MTDDLGYGIPNYFAMELLDSQPTDEGNHIEKYTDGHNFTIVYRPEKYRSPDNTFRLSQEADADQIFESAINNNIDSLLERDEQ